MNRSLLGILASSLVVAQASAQDTQTMPQGLIMSAVAEAEVGVRKVKSTDDPDNNTHFMGSTTFHLSVPLSSSISVQGDLQLEGYADNAEDEAAQHALAVGGHLSWRDPGLGLIGLFGGGTNGSSARGDEDDGDSLGYFVGGEAQIYLGDFTLYGQGGYADYTYDGSDNEGFIDGWFVRGIGRYFVSDYAMIEGEVSYGETDFFIDDGDPGEFLNWGIKGKLRVSDSLPLYATLAYRGGRYHAGEGEDDTGKDHAFLVGVTVLFGPATLKQNDRYGATLSSPMLIGRTGAWTEPLD